MISCMLVVTFYQKWIGCVFMIPVFACVIIYMQKRTVEKKRNELELQFKYAMITMTSALQAGYSLEKALEDAYQVSWNVYGKESNIVYLLGKVVAGRRLNVPIDYLLNEMYEISDLPLIGELAEIISISRKYGGNLPSLIQKETNMIEDKLMIKEEVLAATASVRYEAYVMDLIPPFILCYLNVTGSGFLTLLYDSLFGFLFMTVCLYVYLGTVYWQFRIMEKSIA